MKDKYIYGITGSPLPCLSGLNKSVVPIMPAILGSWRKKTRQLQDIHHLDPTSGPCSDTLHGDTLLYFSVPSFA